MRRGTRWRQAGWEGAFRTPLAPDLYARRARAPFEPGVDWIVVTRHKRCGTCNAFTYLPPPPRRTTTLTTATTHATPYAFGSSAAADAGHRALLPATFPTPFALQRPFYPRLQATRCGYYLCYHGLVYAGFLLLVTLHLSATAAAFPALLDALPPCACLTPTTTFTTDHTPFAPRETDRYHQDPPPPFAAWPSAGPHAPTHWFPRFHHAAPPSTRLSAQAP